MEEYPVPRLVRIFSAYLAGGGIVVSGGQHSGKPVIQCWLLFTSTCEWNPLPADLNTARYRHASVCVGRQVYVIGGEGLDGTEMSSVEILQRNIRNWEILPVIILPVNNFKTPQRLV